MHREEMRQANIEAIAKIAANELPGNVSDDPVDRDWITQFFDHSQDIGEADMQILWARVLAGEITKPGAYSKRTLQCLKILEKWEAEKFSDLCSLAIRDKKGWHILFDGNLDKHIERLGNRGLIQHFIDIGLMSPELHMKKPSNLAGMEFSYFGGKYIVRTEDIAQNKGKILNLEHMYSLRVFTGIGQQLAIISGAVPIPAFVGDLLASLNSEQKKTKIYFDRVGDGDH